MTFLCALFAEVKIFFNNSLIINRKCYFMDFKDVVGINLIIYFFLPIFSIFYSQREDYIVWFKALTLISSGWNFYCFGLNFSFVLDENFMSVNAMLWFQNKKRGKNYYKIFKRLVQNINRIMNIIDFLMKNYHKI